MSGVTAIAQKELAGYFKGQSFYFIAFICVFCMSFPFAIFLGQFVEIANNPMVQQQAQGSQQLNIHYACRMTFSMHFCCCVMNIPIE